MDDMDRWDFPELLRAVERCGFNVVEDRKGQAMVVDAVGRYIATFDEALPHDYVSVAQSVFAKREE